MNRRIWIVGLAMALLAGCEREPAGGVAPPAPLAPAAEMPQAPTPEPEKAVPATSMLVIDGQMLLFPPARLRLEQRDGLVWARLFSEKPAAEIKEPFVHNSYYFDMRLDVEDVAEVPTATWTYTALSSERADSPNGIFLRNLQDHLQPYDVRIEFSKEGDDLTAHIVGQFLLFQERAILPQVLLVEGSLRTTPQVK